MPTYREDCHLGHKVPVFGTDDINDKAITAEKLAEGSVTSEKIAKGSIVIDHLSEELLKWLKALAGKICLIKRADYDALAEKDSEMLYLILDDDSEPEPGPGPSPTPEDWVFGSPMPIVLT